MAGRAPAGDRSQALVLTNGADAHAVAKQKAPCGGGARGNEIFTAQPMFSACDVATGIARALAEGSNDLSQLGRFTCLLFCTGDEAHGRVADCASRS